MRLRMKEVIATILIIVFFLALKFGVNEPVQFSPTLSVILMILLALVFVYILILTIQGKFIERRVVFLLVGIALLLPFFMQFELPLQVSPEVRGAYDALEALQPGSKVLAAYDYDPPSAPELQPMSDAFIRYCFENDLKVIIMGLWPQGPQQANLSLETAFELNPSWRTEKVYGVDYVNLGFQAGNEFVILAMGENFRNMFPRDINGTLYDSLPLVKNITNYGNIDFCMNFSSGKPGTVEWVQNAVDRFDLRVAAGNTAVQAPAVYPYLNAGQLEGLLGGMSGAAEFELATGKLGKATTYLLSQSFAHMVVIAFIFIGNVAFFMARKGNRS